jgi:hypothetical protein
VASRGPGIKLPWGVLGRGGRGAVLTSGTTVSGSVHYCNSSDRNAVTASASGFVSIVVGVVVGGYFDLCQVWIHLHTGCSFKSGLVATKLVSLNNLL